MHKRERILGLLPMLVAGLLLCAVPARAQTPSIDRVSFDDAVRRAIEKNPTVLGATTAILRAEGLLQQARAATRPTLDASVTNTTLNRSFGFQGIVTQPQNQVTIGANLSVPVLAASRWAASAQARDQIDVANLSVADVRRQIAVATAQAYLAVIFQRRQVEVNERARDAANAHLTYANRRFESGAGSQLNQVRAAQEVSADEARLENARLGLRRAQEALGVLVVAAGPTDATDEPTFEIPTSIDEPAWMAARTDVRLFTAEQHAADRVLRDSSKDIWPTVTASFDPQYVTPAGAFQPSKTWRLTVSLTEAIFDGGVRKAAKTGRQAALDSLAQSLAGVQLQARSDVRLAQESVQSYERALTNARLSAQQANDVLRITTVAFEAGATTNLEVIDAQRSARDADTTAALAEDSVRQARLELLVAMGRFPK
jgi:outer membrane protein